MLGHAWMNDALLSRGRIRAVLTALAIMVATTATVSPVVGICGCVTEHSCTTQAVSGLVITVDQAPGGLLVCDATVTARDGTFSEPLRAIGNEPDCTYHGAVERKGT